MLRFPRFAPYACSREDIQSIHKSTAHDPKHVVHPMSHHRLCERLAGGHRGRGAPPCRLLRPRCGRREERGVQGGACLERSLHAS